MYVHSSNEDIRQEKNLYPGGPVWSLKPQKTSLRPRVGGNYLNKVN